MAKSLIIGSGLIGTALRKQIKENVLYTSRDTTKGTYVDISNYESLFSVFSEYRPNVVYLAASNAYVDACEDIETNRDNVRGPVMVLRLCEQFECKFVFFSSSYVFNGKSRYPYSEKQELNPVQNYGKQKEAVENLILTSDAKYVIIRTVGVFGSDINRRNFVTQVIDTVSTKKKVYAPIDQFMNPINSDDLASITVQLANKYNGIFHVAGDECLTKYDFALRVAKYLDREKYVIPVTSEEMKQKALRPKMGCLDCSVIEERGIKIPSFENGLQRFMSMELDG